MTDLCGLWDGSCTGYSCCTASQGIVDTGFSDPAVANAAGDGEWTEEDAFLRVRPPVQRNLQGYWSATEGVGGLGLSTRSPASSKRRPQDELYFAWPVRGGQ